MYETPRLLPTLLTELLIDRANEGNFCSPQSAPSAFKIKLAAINILYDKFGEVV